MLFKQILFLAITAGIVIQAAFGAENATVTVPGCENAPVIDGVPDDQCWNLTKWSGDFRILNLPAEKAAAQTRFKLVHDSKYLYIAAELDEPEMDKLKLTVKQRDGRVFDDDCFEIFLDTANDKTGYIHFAVNAGGTVFDEECRQGGAVAAKSWNSDDTVVATARKGKSWTVEMAIPLIDLNISSSGKGIWGFNITRTRRAGPGAAENSSFAPLSGGFHQPTNFSKMQLENADLSKFCWAVRPCYAVRTQRGADGKIYLNARTFISNNTGDLQFAEARAFMNCDPSRVWSKNKSLQAGEGAELEVELPAVDNGVSTLTLEIRDRRSGQLLSRRRFEVDIYFSPLSIKLTSPGYRNAIYATQELKDITGVVASNLDPAELSGKQLNIVMTDSNENKLASTTLDNVTGSQNFSIPAPAPDGTYHVTAELKSEGKTLYAQSVKLKKLPPAATEIRIGENLITLLNGKPFMPYGWFSIMNEKEWTENGKIYNVMADYNAYYKNDAKLKAWLDAADQAGLKVLIYPYPKHAYNSNDSLVKPLSDDEAAEIRRFVGKWKNHPALLGWYLADEPELRATLPARVQSIYEAVADEDPYHPCIMLNDSLAGIAKYERFCDVLMPDPYPSFLNNGLAAQPIGKVGDFLEAVATSGKARWITPQAFNFNDYGRVNNRVPDFRELRNMQYQSVIGGATGFIWYTHHKSRQYPSCVFGVDFLAREAGLLREVILSPQKRIPLKTSDNEYLKAVYYRNVAGGDVVIAVNNKTAPQEGVISLPANAAGQWYLVSEDRTVNSSGNVLKDRFDTYGVNIYTTNRTIAGKLSLPELEKLIKSKSGK